MTKKTKRIQRDEVIDNVLDAGDECFEKLLKKKNKSSGEQLVAITKKTRMQIQVIREEQLQSEPQGLPRAG